MRCKDGSYKWILDRGKVIEWTADHKPQRVIGTHSDITHRIRSEDQLRAHAETQRVLLREVNHRVKNNLGLILGMLRLEESRGSGDVHTLLSEIEGRIHALASVHSMLSSTEWRPVGLTDLCEAVIATHLPPGGNTRLEISPTALTVDASQAHNLALVLNELATNTAKHAPAAGCVRVDLAAEGAEVVLVYRDDGPGFPAPVLAGTAEPTGIGLQLLRGLVEMSLGGKVTYTNAGGAVTTVRFTPAAPEGAARV